FHTDGSSGASRSLGKSSPLLALFRASRAGSFPLLLPLAFFIGSPSLDGMLPGPWSLRLALLRPLGDRDVNLNGVPVVTQGLGDFIRDVAEEAEFGQLLDLPGGRAVLRPVVPHGLIVGHDDRDDPRVLAWLGVL